MSEKAGKTSTDRLWLKYAKAIEQAVEKQDWARLAKVDLAMRQALEQAGPATTAAEQEARTVLQQQHRRALAQVEQAKTELNDKLAKIREQREGLGAYQLTLASGE
ncbi:hypothetical protein [Ferrimonas pelagia]|uniref:Flagellar protein FliT n=1 Tax=Ferrimonas pelagia TaxID=1177826 RepID=A0ABP9EIP6_9GAMM